MDECKDCAWVAEDGTCAAFECTGLDCPLLPCEQYWIFTFGGDQKHAGKYVKIRGTAVSARDKMFNKYGDKWGFQYSEEEWENMKNDPRRWWDLETELEVIE